MNESQQDPWKHVATALRQRLESLQRSGVGQLPKPPDPVISNMPVVTEAPADRGMPKRVADPVSPKPAGATSPKPTTPRSPAPAAGRPEPPATAAKRSPPDDRRSQLEILRRDVSRCRLCNELATSRKQTVFGVGDPNARLCFFGEAPGADEDRLGEPFVGAAGQLLTKIIEACGLKREDVYIMNVLKCRPPGNRRPEPEEVAHCRPFFESQLELIQPEFICCLGATAAQSLLRTTQPIGRMRGRFHDYRGIRVMATYHPSYLLRTPSAKRDTWEDMKMLMQAMGIEIPKR